MTAKPKKQPAPDAGPSLRFDFNAAAKRALKDHPELRGNMLFIHAGETKPDAHSDDLMMQGVDDDDIADVEKMVRDAKRLKTSFHLAVSREDHKKNLGVLVFHPDRHSIFGAKPSPADDAGTFDHETGHALISRTEGTLSENAADSFAAIRHFQRFDNARENLEYAGWKRAAVAMLLGKTSHLTTFTIDRIICDAEAAKFSSLKPAQTKKIAEEYARKFTPSAKRLAKSATTSRRSKNCRRSRQRKNWRRSR